VERLFEYRAFKAWSLVALAAKLPHHAERRILDSVALADLEKNGARTKPRATVAKVDLSAWPKGTSQALTKIVAARFFSLVETNEGSLVGLLKEHPELPPYRLLCRWRKTYPWFAEGWREAREKQGEWVMQKAFDIAKNATKETAHLCRVQFDIYKHLAGKLNPAVWGERPPAAQANVYTNVQVGISQERLAEIRSSLDATRAYYLKHNGTKDASKKLLPDR